MFQVSVDYSFAAGHALRGYKGKCENVHGHNYKVQVKVNGEKLNSIGLLIDFVEVRATIQSVVERLDHRFLNEFPPFDKVNPSAENLAKYFCEELEPKVRAQGLWIGSVTVWETESTSATFCPSLVPRG